MSTPALSDTDVRGFVDDGYVIVRDLVGADDVAAVRADAERFAAGEYPVSNLPDGGAILAVHFPHWVSPVAARMVRHPGIVSVVSRVAGAHLAHWDGGAKCMQSMLFLKPPGLQGQAWHQDERYIPTRDRSLIGAWIALDDATVENGCLWVLPGSHRRGVLHPTRDHGRPDEFDPSDEAFGFDDGGAVPVELRTGDVVFFNGYLLHRSLRNRSTGTRRALVNHYMSSASLLPWMLPGSPDVATADMRNVVVVDGEDPHAWRGSAAAPGRVFVRPHTGSWGARDGMAQRVAEAVSGD
jgi:ectoine hydroxylase-related dioxygenase (phytanoyl-CoA dioxygenase family)